MTANFFADLGAVTVRGASVSAQDNIAYVITAKASGEQVLVDAPDAPDALRALLREGAADAAVPARVALIAMTHQHWDHVRALAEMAAELGCPIAAGADDVAGIEEHSDVRPSVVVHDGDVAQFDGFTLTAVHLRGHTPGSIAYVIGGDAVSGPTHIAVGDSLFPGGVGNTWGDPARFEQLLNDVTDRLFDRFADDTVILPGHGVHTTLGAERPYLSEWRERGW